MEVEDLKEMYSDVCDEEHISNAGQGDGVAASEMSKDTLLSQLLEEYREEGMHVTLKEGVPHVGCKYCTSISISVDNRASYNLSSMY